MEYPLFIINRYMAVSNYLASQCAGFSQTHAVHHIIQTGFQISEQKFAGVADFLEASAT